jgi:DNA polymerase III epsilon subunit-like protein
MSSVCKREPIVSDTTKAYPVPPTPSSYYNKLETILHRFREARKKNGFAKITIVSDFEYLNAALGGDRPTLADWKEIVQMGAVKYEGNKKVASFMRFVKPTVYANISDKMWAEFTEITHITKETIMEQGIDFKQAWQEYADFIDDNVVVIIAGDREVAKWNWRLLGEPRDEEIDQMKWVILKPLLPLEDFAQKLGGAKQVLSGNLYKLVGKQESDICQDGLTTHNALFDATSMGLFLELYPSTD